MRAYVGASVRGFHDAEDLVQQVALTVARRFDEYDASRPFLAWALWLAKSGIIETSLNDDASYTLAGHLAPDAAIYDRQSGRGQRGRLINELLRFVRVRPGGDARLNPER